MCIYNYGCTRFVTVREDLICFLSARLKNYFRIRCNRHTLQVYKERINRAVKERKQTNKARTIKIRMKRGTFNFRYSVRGRKSRLIGYNNVDTDLMPTFSLILLAFIKIKSRSSFTYGRAHFLNNPDVIGGFYQVNHRFCNNNKDIPHHSLDVNTMHNQRN